MSFEFPGPKGFVLCFLRETRGSQSWVVFCKSCAAYGCRSKAPLPIPMPYDGRPGHASSDAECARQSYLRLGGVAAEPAPEDPREKLRKDPCRLCLEQYLEDHGT